jgi:hypothetical protein
MKDVSGPIRLKVKSLLDTSGFESYANYAPHTAANQYYLISDIGDVETSTMNSIDTQTTFQVGIYTKQNIGISANIADLMAATLFGLLGSTLDLSPDFAPVAITKTGDRSQALEINSALCINRIITFRIENINH